MQNAAMTAEWTKEDRRREPRFRVQKPGLLMFEGSDIFEQCLVLEQSAGGARVLCSPAFRFPGKGMSLVFIAERLLQPVETVWRTDCYAGFSFSREAYHVFDLEEVEAASRCPMSAWPMSLPPSWRAE